MTRRKGIVLVGGFGSRRHSITFVSTIEQQQGLKVAYLEKIAFNAGWIGAAALREQVGRLQKTGHGSYLLLKEDAK